ncbi:basic salivary proline-rich protein 1-like isoform X3 [Aphis gossypii]|uniref:basic salivary proline-rich protein 1-like isoform X3 n=1 Tax=Aphis gossypii TaxID=80765 RepID=UPI0021596C33|nr:basic salivary proline-rich protein 1-like isoform X3 [Aphis gossypii]
MLLRRTRSKMMKIIDCKIYVVLKDSTIFVGILKANSQTFLEHNILGSPALDESNRQKRLLGLIVIPGKNIISIDNKLGSDVPKVPITDIIICRLKDYRRVKTTIKPLVSMCNVRDPNWNIEDCQADIIFEKDLYHIPMVDPTAYIIRGRHRSLPLMALISEDCQQTTNNCLATNGLSVQDYLADIDENEPLPLMPSMGIGKVITKPGMSQNGPPSMSGMAQNRPIMGYNGSPIRSGMAQNRPLMPYMDYKRLPIRPFMSQNGPPSMSGMAQNRPIMGYNGSPIRSGMSQNGPPSMSGMAQNRPLMPYMDYKGLPIRPFGPPSMSGMAQNRPIMGYNESPIRSGMAQNRPLMPYMDYKGLPIRPFGPPSMSGMAQNRPIMGYNGSPLRSGMSQNGPPSMSGMAQNRPLMPYMDYKGSPIRPFMSQNGPPSMSGMAQNRPIMPYMGKGKSSTINKYANQ